MDGTLQARRWWQLTWTRLSLRALMLVVLILACGLGWYVNSVRVQREAIRAIEQAGGKAFYDWQLKRIVTPDHDDLSSNNPGAKPPVSGWIVDRFGPDYYSTVKMAFVIGPTDALMPQVGKLGQMEEIIFSPSRKLEDRTFGPTDAGMAHLRGLTALKKLTLGRNTADGSLGSTKLTGKGLEAIAAASRMQILELQGIPLADADLAVVRTMPDLRTLTLDTPNVTDAGLDHLAGLVELRDLGLQGTGVTAGGIVRLRGLTKLKKLNLALTKVESLETLRALDSLQTLVLSRTPIGDEGLASSSGPGFVGLTQLILANTKITDAGLMHLRDLPKLKMVNVVETAVTDAGVAEFKKVRPNVNVIRQRPPATPRPRPAPAPKK